MNGIDSTFQEKTKKYPKGLRARKQKSGNVFYYFDDGKHETPLGADYDLAIVKYRYLNRDLEGYKIEAPGHHLYRHFDSHGILLYVGISFNPIVRLEKHRNTSLWFYNIARIEVQRFDTLAESEAAERAAIKEELPLFNLRHAPERTRSYAKKMRKPTQGADS